jgi:hypothetical protein
MPNPTTLRKRAARCREIAREYHPRVARPLYVKAMELEREASGIERGGRERRYDLKPFTGKSNGPIFGKA